MFLGQKHLQAHLLHEARVSAAQLAPNGSNSNCFDGFLPIVINMTGYSILFVYLYGHPSIGMGGANKLRVGSLGGLLKAIRLPWIVAGDFNMSPDALKASNVAKELDGVSRVAAGGGTCAQKKAPTLFSTICCARRVPSLS